MGIIPTPEISNPIVLSLPFRIMIELTISALNTYSGPTADLVYIKDQPQNGFFRYVSSDASSADDGAMVLVDSLARRYHRNYEYVTPEMFGAIGNGVSDDSDAIQSAEDYASLKSHTLLFEKTYSIGKRLIKKSNSIWDGAGTIQRIDRNSPTGTQWPLIYANGASDFKIANISLQNITLDVILSTNLPRIGNNQGPGTTNACIDLYNCSRFTIVGCKLTNFSQGILYRKCFSFLISNNNLIGGTSKTIESIIDGTFTPFESNKYLGTGGIVVTYEASGPSPASKNGRILGNSVSIPGLDCAITVYEQVYDDQPLIASDNTIEGAHCGIICYQGTYPDPPTVKTYSKKIIISNNLVRATWEQGIYIRGVNGILCSNNIIENAAKLGTGGPGAPCGGIVTRINPFNPGYAPSFNYRDQVGEYYGVEIIDNLVFNTGRPGSHSDGSIHLRIEGCRVEGNRVYQDETVFTNKEGFGIFLGSSENVHSFWIKNNIITNFEMGINYAELRSAVKPPYPRVVSDNTIFNVVLGIVIRSAASHVSVVGNQIYKAGTAIIIRYAPYSKVMNNRVLDSSIGIQLEDGNLASNYLYLMNMSLVPDNKRKGGTIIVKSNAIENCSEPYKIVGVTMTDLSFFGRCSVWEGDIVDGVVYDPYVFPNAIVPTTNSKTWNIGDKVRNTTIASGVPYEKICVSPGTYGDPVNTTGDITNGSKSITNVADMGCIGPGIYLKIDSLIRRVVSVDLTSFTVDKEMSANGTGIVIEDAIPVFVNLIVTP